LECRNQQERPQLSPLAITLNSSPSLPKIASRAQASDFPKFGFLPSDCLLSSVLVRSLFPLEKTPGLISLLAGKPNPTTFPFKSLSFTAESPRSSGDGNGEGSEISLTLDKADLAEGLQYGATAGLEQLRQWFFGLQEFSHGRKKEEGSWTISVGAGSQDLIYKVTMR
jgi:hypothetical protein